MTMIKEHPIARPRLVKSRYYTADLSENVKDGLDLNDKRAVYAAAVFQAREKRPRLLDKKYKWKLIWANGAQVRVRYEWR